MKDCGEMQLFFRNGDLQPQRVWFARHLL